MTQRSPFRYFKTSPEIIRLAVMLYIRFPLSLRKRKFAADHGPSPAFQPGLRVMWRDQRQQPSSGRHRLHLRQEQLT